MSVRRVLFVDDEPQVLDGLKKALRPWRKVLEVETRVGGRAGIEALEHGLYDAVVSDSRMPEIDGTQVLRAAQKRQPSAVRVVLSGQVDKGSAQALAAVAHQFLGKPCAVDVVLSAIESACRVRDNLSSEAVRQMVAELGELPLPPKTYQRLSTLLEEPNATVEQVAAIIEESPTVTAQVLKLVSSAFFGLPRKVSTVREAVVLLGLAVVREVVLVAEVFSQPDTLGVIDTLQERALARLRVMKSLSETSPPFAALASAAALLSDLGAYVLALKAPTPYAIVWRGARGGLRTLAELEQETFGTTHEHVGAALLAIWGLPPAVVTAVGEHHRPLDVGAGRDLRGVLTFVCLLEDWALTSEEQRGPLHTELTRMALQLQLTSRLTSVQAHAIATYGITGQRAA